MYKFRWRSISSVQLLLSTLYLYAYITRRYTILKTPDENKEVQIRIHDPNILPNTINNATMSQTRLREYKNVRSNSKQYAHITLYRLHERAHK